MAAMSPCWRGCLRPEPHPAHPEVTENQHGRVVSTRYQGFESAFLQRRVGRTSNHPGFSPFWRAVVEDAPSEVLYGLGRPTMSGRATETGRMVCRLDMPRGSSTSSCQMRARSGKFRDSPITTLQIAGTLPPFIIPAARDRSLGASSATGPAEASAGLSSASMSDATAARATRGRSLPLVSK